MAKDNQQDEPVVYASVEEEAFDYLDTVLTLTLDKTQFEYVYRLLRKIKESPEVLQPLLDRLRDLALW